MLRAWDQVLSNPYINASTSGFLGNWYIAFNQWAANQTTLTQTGNCYNPLYQRASGNLAAIVNPSQGAQQITGCIPQAQFYPLLTQVWSGIFLIWERLLHDLRSLSCFHLIEVLIH